MHTYHILYNGYRFKNNLFMLAENNNRKQKNPIIFKRKSIGDSSLKKFDIETIRNPVDTIVETTFFLIHINNHPLKQFHILYTLYA